MQLTPQEKKIYKFILEHRGCTTRDMQSALGIECPSARITGLRNKGVSVVSVGQKKYPGARPFEMYAIKKAEPQYEYVERQNADGSITRVRQLV